MKRQTIKRQTIKRQIIERQTIERPWARPSGGRAAAARRVRGRSTARRRCGVAVIAGVVSALALQMAVIDRSAGQTPPAASAEVAAPETTNPAVAAILARDVETDEERVWSAVALAELGRADLGKPRLKRVLDAGLNDQAAADLAARLGPAMLVRLSGIDALAPEGPQLARKLLDASLRRARDPRRLARLLQRLTDPSPAVRLAAIHDLRMGGTGAARLMIERLAGQPSGAEAAGIADALASIGPEVAGMIGAALASEDAAFRTRLLAVCRRLDDDASGIVPFLLSPAVAAADRTEAAAARQALGEQAGDVPDRAEAAALLVSYVQGYLGGTLVLPSDAAGRVTLWQWDEKKHVVMQRVYPARHAGWIMAARLGRDLARVAGDAGDDAADLQRIVLLAWWQAAAVDADTAATYRQAADRLADTLAIDQLEKLLDEAIEGQYIEAAIAAVERIGRAGRTESVVGDGRRPAPLVRAIRSGDRRLTFAALGAVLQIDPPPFYAGASAVPDALELLCSSTGSRRAVVADPRPADGRRIAALLTGLGYDTRVVSSGRTLLDAARQSVDVQIIVLRLPIDGPTTRETLYRLRRDWRTSRIPVALIAGADRMAEAHRLAAATAMAGAFPPPRDRHAIEQLVGRMNDRAGPWLLDDPARRAQTNAALGWLAKLADRRRGYQLARPVARAETVLYVPGQRSKVVDVLAAAGTPSSQRQLVDLASLAAAPVEARRQALGGLERSIRRFGILLTSREILRQYDRYNASEHADVDTQTILASILDLLEAAGTNVRAGPER